MRVLCIEDDEDICQLLTALLGLSDLEAVAASTATEALRLMREERFDLYLMDGRLPDADGVALCEQIRLVDETARVVFFTGKGLEADRDAALLAGATAYVVKPDTGTLVSTVKRLPEDSRHAEG